MAIIQHNSRPQKVGTLIWLTLNRHLATIHGDLPHVQGLHRGDPQSPEHCLFECPFTKRAWEAIYYIWQKWGAPNDITLSWPFIMLGEAIFKKEDPLKVQGTMQGASPTSNNRLTSFATSSSTSFDRRDAGSILITSIPLGKSFSMPGWLPLRLGWPLGRPSTPFSRPGNLVFRLGLIRP